MKAKKTAYHKITEKFLESFKKNVLPWSKPWKVFGYMNASTGHVYRGVNVIACALFGEGDNGFLTFNQAKKLGGKVKKGAKGLPIYFTKTISKKDKDGNPDGQFWLARVSWVFGVSQVEGIDPKKFKHESEVNEDFNEIEEAENFLEKFKNFVLFDGGNRAFYNLQDKKTHLPKKSRFENEIEFYKVSFHELVHWAYHKMNGKMEDLDGTFASASYSKEELVAEIGANFIASVLGLDISETFDNSVAYVQKWASRIEDDPRLIVQAANEAQRRVDFLFNIN